MQIELTEELGQTRINVQQSTINDVGPLGVTIALALLLILGWLSQHLLGKVRAGQGNGSLEILIVVMVFLMTNLYMLYDLACRRFNKVQFVISENGDLTMGQRPIPRKGLKKVNRENIRQFYIKKHLNQSDHRKVEYLSLCVRFRNGITKKLLFERIEDYANLRELETIIEERLGITEMPMPNEYRPGILAKETTPRGSLVSKQEQEKGNIIQIGELEWDILFRKQYDWQNGETEQLLILGFGQQRRYLYQNTGGQYSQLAPLSLAQQLELGLHLNEGHKSTNQA
mgnify:CR=1 FL=1